MKMKMKMTDVGHGYRAGDDGDAEELPDDRDIAMVSHELNFL